MRATTAPRVSIVTATYNRADVLRYTIESVLAQTFSDWELLVVGDACTDDTADAVASFGDQRIRFWNRATNSGDQATPNNEGVRAARGEFVALLNHDDIWTRQHLSSCLTAIEAADVVFTLALNVAPNDHVHLSGACVHGEYDPSVTVLASTLFLRRSAWDAAGEWCPARTIHAGPSQEWVFRAWKSGLRLRSVPRATVVAIPSWKDSYVSGDSALHAECARLVRDDPEVVERLLTMAAAAQTAAMNDASLGRPLVRVAKNAIRRVALLLGIHPHSLHHAVRYRRRGGFIDALRAVRGLPPLPRGDVP